MPSIKSVRNRIEGGQEGGQTICLLSFINFVREIAVFKDYIGHLERSEKALKESYNSNLDAVKTQITKKYAKDEEHTLKKNHLFEYTKTT